MLLINNGWHVILCETEQYIDAQGRVLRIATQGFDGGYQYQDKHYDALGRLLRESAPYGNGTGAEYTEFSDFDELDRPARRSMPNGKSGLESTYDYDGLTTNITVGGRTMSRTYGSQGWLYETVDAQNGTNRFAYDSAGRPLIIQDANGNVIKATYNGFGHKTKVDDPNQGITLFGYNTLGELDKQTDANGVVQTFTLDTLGRIATRATVGGNAPSTATYVWDTPKLGMLSSETENGISRTYAYTTALQLASTTVNVDGANRTIKHQYDSFYGRPKALEYPNGLTLKYAYNDYGYLEQTSNAASGYIYRQVTAMDEAGHITGAELGNSVMRESRQYNPEGTMANVQVDAPLGRIHGHYYDNYDDFMNLIDERNATTGLNKHYRYDTLNRLEAYTFSNTNPLINATVNYAYDKVGNFLKKTDYSANSNTAYRYGGSACGNKPNAVCQLTKLIGSTVNFQYDAKGNLRIGDGLTMTYNAMDKPLTITGRGPGNSTVTGFTYGSDGMRAKQSRNVSGVNTTTYYVDKYYEIDNDGSWRTYIDDIAVLSYTPARKHLLQFTLRGRLGSATTMADQNGNIISQRYFDPFGRTAAVGSSHSKDILNKNTLLSSLQDLNITNKNRRGFTDHEHLNEQQLIHMNGRVYDYNLGRFMSVDPLIQSPTSTQSVNPYSYIMNNPLAGTDPTGYAAEEFDKKIQVDKKTEALVSNTGSHIKRKVTSASGTATSSNGARAFSANISNGKVESISVGKMSDFGNLGNNAAKGNSGTNVGGEANLKINRLNDQINEVEAAKAKESEYSITLVAHQDESIEFKGVEIPDVIGHAFVIMRGPNGEFAKGFWPGGDGASFEDFISDTPLGGTLSDEGDYSSRFKAWQATGKDPQGGQFAFRSFALTKTQYQGGVSAISSWNSTPYMGQSRMCGSFATHVLRATGQSYGNSKTPYYLFSDMGGSFDKN
ncbi:MULTISPECIES: RHS repeat domain-containing protein [unclassified Shewanella]|uniref:RHS repeat domain-containing protein n=1 Tax=unclassified Shewanella TaxID=196818 RepID=UPI0022B7E447|nr:MULTISPECIES: RHS repeat-associated core domain-containing protein [unclassified Shewanella]